jgi:protein TonB
MKHVLCSILSLCAVGAASADTVVVPCPDTPQPGISVAARHKADTQNPWRYPAQARRQREHGTVTLRLVLDQNGSAERVSLLKGSGSSILDRSASMAAKSKSVRFCPLQGGAPVAAGVAIVNVTYSLTETVAQL